jgi:peptide-methionine (S)-S-oxide reductase
MKTTSVYLALVTLFLFSSCSGTAQKELNHQNKTANQEQLASLQKAYFASGCFWCVEAIFEEVKGVAEVISGYSGGSIKNPTYEMVSAGKTRHAESVVVYYDSTQVSYATLLEVFFGSHDPTTPNQQGPDKGTQYRSAIFYQNENEKTQAEEYIKTLAKEGIFSAEIITEIRPFTAFYVAEADHQNYEKNHPENPYVQHVSIPRLNRFKERFPHLLK